MPLQFSDEGQGLGEGDTEEHRRAGHAGRLRLTAHGGDGIADDDYIGSGFTVEIGFFGVADAAAYNQRDIDMAGHAGNHFFPDRMTGPAARLFP